MLITPLATQAQFNNPVCVFVSSPDNEIYIADQNNHRIRKILKNGNIVTIAGNGQGGFSGDYGPATNAKLFGVTKTDVGLHNFYIADNRNHRIRKILQNGTIITIAGNGEGGFSGDNGPAIRAQLNGPTGVFVSSNNEVYIADQRNHRIRKVLENGTIVTIAGIGTLGVNGDNGPATKAQLFNPKNVFVSENNEVYIADQSSARIRKILKNGNITTIAGNCEKGFSGDNILATKTQLNYPGSIFVTPNNEVYIADDTNNRIRKVLQNGTIITIAGNGTYGFSGDNGPATQAQLCNPTSVFVTPNNEVYITDNNRVRKILENGNIITIAGNGTYGFSGDSEFHISLNTQINSSTKVEFQVLKKHSRDQLFNLEIYGFMPLLERVSTKFSQILKNEKIMFSFNTTQYEIIPKLIDSLIYNNHQLIFSKNELLDVLYILGLFKNGEFINLKRSLTSEFVNSVTLNEFTSEWERIELLLTTCREFGVQNHILEYLNNYCIEFAAISMKTTEGNMLLASQPIVLRNAAGFFSKMVLTRPSPIIIDEEIERKPQTLETLLNDMKTSDIQIRMGEDKYLYCHKTVLGSSSSLFEALFESGSSYSDLSNGILTPDESEDLELLEIIIKYCYGITFDRVDTVKIIALLDMAMKHEIEYLIYYCKNNFILTMDNYFSVISACKHYLDLPFFDGFFKEIIRFGIANKNQLFYDMNIIAELPDKVVYHLFN